MKRFIVFLIILVPFSGLAQSEYLLAGITKELRENANSILLEENDEVDVSQPGKMILKRHRVVAVLNKAGVDDVETYVGYDKGTRIKNIEASVTDFFGKEITNIKRKDFKDVSAVDGFSIYSDDRVVYLDYVPTKYPYILSFTYEIESNSTAYLPRWNPISQYNTSTKNSSFKIKFDPSNKPRYKASNLEGFDISITESETEISCIAKNMMAFSQEHGSPSLRDFYPNVIFALDQFHLVGLQGRANDWGVLGAWINEKLLFEAGDLPEETVLKMKGLVKGEVTNEAKARKVYEYVQNKVRYISVQIGIGGWKPAPASEVDKLGYGDCKALTNYTKVLLDAVGVPSYYTLLYSDRNEKDIDKDFPVLQGNHAILGVPNGDDIIWLECTSQLVPFGYIGNNNDDRDVFMVTPDGGEIVHTKKYEFDENFQKTEAIVEVTPNGDVVAQVVCSTEGLQYGGVFSVEREDARGIEAFYKENKWDYLNNLTIASAEFENNRKDIRFKETLEVQIPGYCERINDNYLLAINIFNQVNYVPPRSKNRKLDLKISEGYKDVDTAEIQIPEGFFVETLPENTEINNKFGAYLMNIAQGDDNKLVFNRTLIMKKGVFPPEDYNEYRSFMRQVSRLDKTKIILKKH